MRFAIVGCGLIGQKRAAAARARGHEIVVAVDLDPDRAGRLAGQYGARAATDWRDAISADVDAVVVATLHGSLAEISLAAVDAGRHVLVEKPAGRAAAEVAPVAAAAERSGVVVKTGFNHRFHPAIRKAHALFQAGEIGAPMFIRARYGHGGRVGYEKEWRCEKALSGGGELIDQGAHLIDLSRWFLGDLTLDYAALPTCYWNIDVEDNCFLALRGAGATVAWLHATWTEWKNTFWFEVAGRDGKLTVDGLGGSYGVERLTLHKMLPQMGPPETTTWEYPFPDRSWEEEFDDFVAAVQERRRATGDIHDALAMLELIDQAYSRNALQAEPAR